MLEATSKHLSQEKRGISSVIVAMLGLVLIVIVVGNVVLWSYQMNQFDLERIQEKISITEVQHIENSLWFTSLNEYKVNVGNHTNGTYEDTKTVDNNYEIFTEEPAGFPRLQLAGGFSIDIENYPLTYANSIEMQIQYRTNSSSEKWFLRAYNWTSSTFSDVGFSNTAGHQPVPDEWNEYSIKMNGSWASYVAPNGTLILEFSDEGVAINLATIEIDFFGLRSIVDGVRLTLSNSSPATSHIVAFWIVGLVDHRRYHTSLFVNSGEVAVHTRLDVSLPGGNCTVKVVTEKGNVAVFP